MRRALPLAQPARVCLWVIFAVKNKRTLDANRDELQGCHNSELDIGHNLCIVSLCSQLVFVASSHIRNA